MTLRCPKTITGEAAAAWKRFAGLLPTVTEADAPALQLLAETWAERAEAQEQIKKQGQIVKMPNGWPGPNPYLPIRTKADQQITRLLREFGLTPAARAKIKITEESEAAELEF